MTKPATQQSHAHYWLSFVAVCLLQIVIACSAIYYVIDTQTEQSAVQSDKDLNFLFHVIQDKLQEKNYTSVENLLTLWGEEQTGHIASVTLSMANGFVLGQFQSPSSSQHLHSLSVDIPYSYKGLATLGLVIDDGATYAQAYRLSLFFVLSILIVNSLLALMIQLNVRKKLLTASLNEQRLQLSESVIELKEQITARRKAETNLAASEEKYRILMNNQSDAIFLHELLRDGFSTFSEVNQRAIDNYGYSRDEFLRLSARDITPEEETRKVIDHGLLDSFKKNGTMEFEARHIKKSGESFPVEIKSSIVQWQGKQYILSTARDIGERIKMQEKQLQLEQQMLHAQKLESLGILAGGIAHDFNNILMSVLGHSDLAVRRLPANAPANAHLEQIKKAAEKAANLSNQMLAYSGRGKFVVKAINLSHLIADMEYMLSVSVSKKAVIRYQLHEHLPSIEADATQLQQIIMNLVINASDAIGERSGIVVISTGFMDCDRHYLEEVWLDENLPEGSYVYIEIADTGCGMDQNTISKIFDPFFTTKFTGRGLGMSSVLGIVRGHKGAIKIYSELNKGSTMKVLFPASESPAARYQDLEPAEMTEMSGTVLLVDDEESIRSLGKGLLEVLGLDVITADDGRDAVRIYKERHRDIQFVLMDLTMPHMNGEEAFREIRRINPTAKVIMSSGYNQHDVSQKFLGKEMAGFLQKPYQLSTLQKAIQALDL